MAEGSGEALLDATQPVAWVGREPDDAPGENATDLSGLAAAPAAAAPDPVLYAIQLWFTPILVTLGSFGNCLCVVVFFGTKLKKLSSR